MASDNVNASAGGEYMQEMLAGGLPSGGGSNNVAAAAELPSGGGSNNVAAAAGLPSGGGSNAVAAAQPAPPNHSQGSVNQPPNVSQDSVNQLEPPGFAHAVAPAPIPHGFDVNALSAGSAVRAPRPAKDAPVPVPNPPPAANDAAPNAPQGAYIPQDMGQPDCSLGGHSDGSDPLPLQPPLCLELL